MLNKINQIVNDDIQLIVFITFFFSLGVIYFFKKRSVDHIETKLKMILGEFYEKWSFKGKVIDLVNPSKGYGITQELEAVVISLFNQKRPFFTKPFNYLEKVDGNLRLRFLNLQSKLIHYLKDKIAIGKNIFSGRTEFLDLLVHNSIAVLAPSGIGKTHLLKSIIAQAVRLGFQCKVITNHNNDFSYRTINPHFENDKLRSILDEAIDRFDQNKSGKRIVIVFDEVQSWLPQQPKEIKDMISRIINEGRKFNVSIIISSQTQALVKLSQKIGVDLTTVSYLAIGGFVNEATIQALGVPQIKRIYQENLKGLFYCGRAELNPIQTFYQVRQSGYGDLIK